MSVHWKTVMTTASVAAALAGGSALHAQTTAPSKPQSGGMMQGQHGDMTGMMNMMAQNQMMESCNKMMQHMNSSKGTDRPTGKSAPHTSQ